MPNAYYTGMIEYARCYLSQHRKLSTLLVAVALCCTPLPQAFAESCHNPQSGPRIGLVLSGGGARGTAHVGVLQLLEELRVPVHCIAGTSLGSVVGALYALGLPATELREVVETVDWNRGFIDKFPRGLLPLRRKDEEDEFLLDFELGVSGKTLNLPRGVIQGHSLHLLLKELFAGASLVHDFDRLPIPFRAVATDVVNAKPVALGAGDLARSVQASMAIPGVYAPVEIDDKVLVDGGVTQNLPVSVIRQMGADIVIAVDIGTPLSKREDLQSVVSILDQLTNVLTQKNVGEDINRLNENDIFIQPDLGQYRTMDFAEAPAIVAIGLEAAQQQRAALSQLGVDVDSYSRYLLARPVIPELPTTISELKLVQSSKLSETVLQDRLDIGDEETSYDNKSLHKSLDALHSTGLFEQVTYEYSDEDATAITVYAEEKSWGPDIVKFGFSLEDDFGGNNNFNLALGYTRKAINSRGADLRAVGQIGEAPRILLEYFQPLAALSEYYSLLRYEHQQYTLGEFAGNSQTGQFRTRRNEIAYMLGKQFQNHSDVRIGIAKASGRVKRQVGDDTLLQRNEFDEGAVFLRYRFDTLDSNRFPASGNRLRLFYESSQEALGADDEFDAVSVDALSALKSGTNRFVASITLQSATRNRLPAQRQFSRGGLLNTSGLNQDVQVGQHTGRVDAVWYRPLYSDQIAALDYPIYYGASIGLGGVFQRRAEIDADNFQFEGNIFVAADTPAGPVFLGVGASEGQGFSALLSLGLGF